MAMLKLTGGKKYLGDTPSSGNISSGSLHDLKKILAQVFLLGAIIFAGELVVMMLLMYYPINHPLQEAFIDSATLVLIVSPALYLLYYLPIRKRVDALHTSKQEIRALTRKLMDISEDEQRKISLDLHDEFGQILSAMRMEIETLRPLLKERYPELLPRCASMNKHLDAMRTSIRTIAARLRPSALDDLGIQDALDGMVLDLHNQFPALHCTLEVTGLKRRPTPQIETAIYRVCQEAITNIINHARAKNIEVRLTSSYPDLILTIRDDGCGFQMHDKLSTHNSSKHLGIIGMRERTTSLGGQLLISSQPDQGTTIRAVFPQQENPA